jgi:flagellin-like hook-associated protein FlgL
MGSIVLSAAVRQNLLSLQGTAALMATTQNNLSTGNKVNSALDNPTNFFTAQGLNNRSSDISSLLDGISNGVQVIQAANTGITSLQSLVSQAKSIANQALQTSIGYSTKASVSGSVTGASATNLLGSGLTAGTFTGGTVADSKTSTTASATTKLSGGTTAIDGLTTSLTTSDTLTVNGKTITFNSGSGTSTNANGGTIDVSTGTINDVLTAINNVAGAGTASINASGKIVLSTGTAGSGINLGGSALTALNLASGAGTASGTNNDSGFTGFSTAVAGSSIAAAGSINNQTLIIGATGVGGVATTLTFGSGTNQISTLTALNTTLAANNLQATIDSTGKLTIATTNDAASASLGTLGGTAVTVSGTVFNATNTGYSLVSAPVADTTSQTTRSNLVSQYNALLTQIDQTAADSSFNGVNLLNGDQLQLTFNETGKSKLAITGVNNTSAGLGLTALATTAFKDNQATNSVLSSLNTVSTTLRSQASAFGSNLSVVQTRQDFNKNLINVLQTGSANLTQADINLEAANSQALQTRQSLSVSALSLANQAQQSVLQLLR